MPMQHKNLLLSIDNGTQSIRAMLFDPEGTLIEKSAVPIEPYFSNNPGWAEQHADYFWSKLCQACQNLWANSNHDIDNIAAVSLTAQRATAVAVDKNGKPLRPTFSWLDQRQVTTQPSLTMLESFVMGAIGLKPAVKSFHQRAESNWIAQMEPQIWAQTNHYLLISGYHIYRLTGRYRDAVASQVGYLPFDFKSQCWANPRDWKWRALPIKASMLPNLVSAGSILGSITKEASKQTGIPEELPLIASGSDKACEVLGSGCLDSMTGSISYGSLATFNITNDKYLEAIRGYPAYPGVIPGTFNVEMAVQRGYWMINWFKREFGLREQQLAEKLEVTAETLFDDLLTATLPGADGLILQPFWSPNSYDYESEARGSIIGFTEDHGRAHLYRSIIEGIAFALRYGKEQVEKQSRRKIRRLVVSGGGSQSDHILQITADVFALPVERPNTSETSGLGAAISAATGVGIYPDLETAAIQMTHTAVRFNPIPKNVLIYDQIYNQVYTKLYGRLQPSFKKIQSIISR